MDSLDRAFSGTGASSSISSKSSRPENSSLCLSTLSRSALFSSSSCFMRTAVASSTEGGGGAVLRDKRFDDDALAYLELKGEFVVVVEA